MRKTAAILLILILCCTVWAPYAQAETPFHLKAKSAILMNMTDGRILYAYNPDLPLQPVGRGNLQR